MKPRSTEQHRRFFALIAAAFDQWPETCAFQPDNAEHLRAWLLVKAKHCTINTYYLPDDAGEYARLIPIISASMFKQYSWARANGNELQVCVPSSIAYESLGHEAFCKLSDEVGAIIEEIIGVPAEKLLVAKEQAA